MATLALRDRFFTPKVAHAIVSPSAIVATGAGAAAGILVGLGPIGAIIGGAAFLGLRIAAAIPRGPKATRIDPFTLDDPWRRMVQDAVQARAQFADAVRSTDAGPLRDRLAEIGERINDGVEECWKIARAGHALTQARKRIDLAGIQRELADVGPATTGLPTESSTARDETIAALQSQIATTNRMDTTISSTRDRLRLLNARLDESVTRSIELSVSSTSESAIEQVGSDVSAITTEMEALRQAIEVTNTPMAGTG